MDEKMLKEFERKMRALAKSTDAECAHAEADSVMVEFLRKLGFDKLADLYDKVEKWYG